MKPIADELAKNEAVKMKATGDGLANQVVKMKAPNAFRILKGPILKCSILKGLCPSAQGCEERATLGNRARSLPTLKGLQRCLAVLGRRKIWSRNPFRVEFTPSSPPRVARSSQPWALRRNPF